jgi:hypothetical protein
MNLHSRSCEIGVPSGAMGPSPHSFGDKTGTAGGATSKLRPLPAASSTQERIAARAIDASQFDVRASARASVPCEKRPFVAGKGAFAFLSGSG